MKKSLVCITLLGMFLLPLMAHADTVEIFGGYQYLHTGNLTVDGASESNTSRNYNGWDAAATVNLSHHFGVTGDFSGNYNTTNGLSTDTYTFSGGPVVFTHLGPIKPFAHALFGGVHTTYSADGASITQNGYTIMAGGGLDLRANRLFSIRLAQFDWVYYHLGSTNVDGSVIPSLSQSNNVRISSGIVIKF